MMIKIGNLILINSYIAERTRFEKCQVEINFQYLCQKFGLRD